MTITYKQHNGIGRYDSEKFSLQRLFNEVRSSVLAKRSIDVDFVNSIITIIIYLFKKFNLEVPNIIKYSNDRENILKKIDADRSVAKKIIIKILNGGFLEKYHDDEQINKFLKKVEEESNMLLEYFYKLDRRIDDESINNYKGKNFSRILQDLENKMLRNLYDYFIFDKIKMISLIFDGIVCLPNQRIDITDIQNYI